MTTGQKIATLRRQHGISQEELAHRMNVSRQAVSKWENDTAVPTNDNLLALAGYFNMTLSSFLDDEILKTDTKNAEDEDRLRDDVHQALHSARTTEVLIKHVLNSLKAVKIVVALMAIAIALLLARIVHQDRQINELNNMKNNYINTINGIYTELNNIRFLTNDPDSYSNYFQYSYFNYDVLSYDKGTNVAQIRLSLMPDSYTRGSQARFVLRNGTQDYSFDATMENDKYTATGDVQCADATAGSEQAEYQIFLYVTDEEGKTKCFPLYEGVDFAIDYRFRISDLASQSTAAVSDGKAEADIVYQLKISCTEKSAPQKMVLKIYADNNKQPIFEKGYGLRYYDWGLEIDGSEQADTFMESAPIDSTHGRASWSFFDEHFFKIIENDAITPSTVLHAYVEFTDSTGYTLTTADLLA